MHSRAKKKGSMFLMKLLHLEFDYLSRVRAKKNKTKKKMIQRRAMLLVLACVFAIQEGGSKP